MVVSIDVIISSQLQVIGETVITIIRNHDLLANLDYESSGHTGFASAKDLEAAGNNKTHHYTYHALECESVDVELAKSLMGALQNGIVEMVPGSFYDVSLIVGKNDTEHHIFYFDKLADYFSSSSETTKYILESNEAIYEIIKNYEYYDDSTTWTLYTRRKKLYEDSSILSEKANAEDVKNLETQLELYTYTRSQIVAEYLSEYSAFIGQTVVSVNYTDYDRRTYEFLNKNIGKWGWLKEWLIACRTAYETNAGRLEVFLSGDETFWAYEMWAFINCASRDEYPGATDYSIDEYANGWKPETTLEKLQSDLDQLTIKVPTPPTTQGTYYLCAEVDENGDVIYSWKIQ